MNWNGKIILSITILLGVIVLPFLLFNEDEPLPVEESKNSSMTRVFIPKQCEQMPWQTWYEQGHGNFIKEPTDEELIKAYYSSKNIGLTEFRKEMPPEGTNYAAVCGNGYGVSYYITIDSTYETTLFEEGWLPLPR